MARVLYVIANDAYGGGERVFEDLIRRRDPGSEVAAAAGLGGRFERELKKLGVPYFELKLQSRLSLSAVAALRAIIDQFQPDIIHSQGKRADFHVALAGLGKSARLLSTVAMPVEGFPINQATKAVYRLVDYWVERRFDKIIVVSDVLRRLLTESHGLAPDRVSRIYNGIDPAEFGRSTREEARRALGLGAEEKVIGCVGRLVWQKGFSLMIDAMPEVLQGEPKAVLTVFGDGPLREELKERAEKLGLGTKVKLFGFRDDVPRVLAALDVFAMPSLKEGFPILLLEAMAAGCPVVATDIDGVREAWNERAGALVPPNDPSALAKVVLRLLKNPTESAAFARAGREHAAKNFSLSKMIERTQNLYRELARG